MKARIEVYRDGDPAAVVYSAHAIGSVGDTVHIMLRVDGPAPKRQSIVLTIDKAEVEFGSRAIQIRGFIRQDDQLYIGCFVNVTEMSPED